MIKTSNSRHRPQRFRVMGALAVLAATVGVLVSLEVTDAGALQAVQLRAFQGLQQRIGAVEPVVNMPTQGQMIVHSFVPLAGWPVPPELPEAPVVFVSDRDGSSQIYRMVPGASSPVKLTSGGVVHDPEVSPDGRRVAYGLDDDWPFFESIFAVAVEGGSAEPLVRDQYASDRSPSWSENGRSLAFTRSVRTGDMFVMLKDLDTGSLGTFAGGAGWTAKASSPAWSPAGDQLAYCITPFDGSRALHVRTMSIDEDVVLVDSEGDDCEPAWSPDGSRIAFSTNASGSFQIYTVPVDRSEEPSRLTRFSGNSRNPTWSPDGEWIAFDTTHLGKREIVALHVRTGDWVNLTSSPSDDHSPDFGPGPPTARNNTTPAHRALGPESGHDDEPNDPGWGDTRPRATPRRPELTAWREPAELTNGCSIRAARGLSSRAIETGGSVTVTLEYDVTCATPMRSDVVLAVSGVFGDRPANADMPLTAAVREGIFGLTNHVTWGQGSRVGVVVMQQDATTVVELSSKPGDVLEALSDLWIVSELSSQGAAAALGESRALLEAGGAGDHGSHVVVVAAADTPLASGNALREACAALQSLPASLHVLDVASAAWPTDCDVGERYHIADSGADVVALLDQVGSYVFSRRQPQLITYAERLTDRFSLVEGAAEPPSSVGPGGWLTWTLQASLGEIVYELRADGIPGLHRTASESRLQVVLDGKSYEQTVDLGDICVYPTGQPERCSTFATATPVGAELTPPTPTQPTPTMGPTHTPRVKDETPTGTATDGPAATPTMTGATAGPPAYSLYLPASLAAAALR